MTSDLVYELTRGIAYRRIRHAHQKTYTTGIPFFGALLFCAIYFLIPEKNELLGKDGILSSALSLFSTLPGFYFAGLAAVATFGGADMEKDMPDPAPEIDIRHKGKMIDTKLSRRKYLSYLFSYLVVLSFLLCGIIFLINTAQPTIADWGAALSNFKWGCAVTLSSEAITVFILLFLAISLAVTTLQGLFFLAERIHQP